MLLQSTAVLLRLRLPVAACYMVRTTVVWHVCISYTMSASTLVDLPIALTAQSQTSPAVLGASKHAVPTAVELPQRCRDYLDLEWSSFGSLAKFEKKQAGDVRGSSVFSQNIHVSRVKCKRNATHPCTETSSLTTQRVARLQL